MPEAQFCSTHFAHIPSTPPVHVAACVHVHARANSMHAHGRLPVSLASDCCPASSCVWTCDVCADMCADMCEDMCENMSVEMCAAMCVDMSVDMCVNMCMGTCYRHADRHV